MTKIAFVADVHVANFKRWGGAMVNGLNQRGAEVVETLRLASTRAKVEGCFAFVVLGDLFDHTRPTPQLVRATADALLAGGLQVIIILGNHDIQSDGEMDHACASLALIPGIRVIAQPTLMNVDLGVELVCAPYLPGLASEWLPASIAACVGGRPLGNRRRILATHLGVFDEETPAFMKMARDAVGLGQMRFWCDANDIDLAFAGNWHAYKYFPHGVDGEADVIIPGTLCPNGFQEPDQGRVGWMVTYDTDGPSFHKVAINGPRFFTQVFGANPTTVWEAGRGPAPVGSASRLYVRVKCERDELDEAMAMRDAYVKRGDVAFVEVDGDDNTLIQDAAKAAVAAAHGEGAVVDYAALVEVEPPGTKDGVAKRIDAYRKAAL